MKIAKATLTVFTILAILAVIIASESALARSGGRGGGGRSGGHVGGSHFGGSHFSGRHFGAPRVNLGIVVGAPFGYYPPPYYYYPQYYPPIVTAPSLPPVYIEQGSSGPAPAPFQGEGYWYYCAESQAYYPYVKECAEGWQHVAPQPPPG
jgi:hypothetical protein